MEEENKKKKKSLLYYIIKKIRISHIIILIVLLAANTYAWFIYVNIVSNSVDVHVKSWRIDFDDGTQPVTDYVNVYVDNVYPGMTTFEKPINAYNYSEVSANVTFSIIEAQIMDETYVTVEGRNERSQTVLDTDLTSAQLINKLGNDYPFKIRFDLSSSTMEAQDGEATYTISIEWPYESGDDDADTLWGVKAYQFKEEHPSAPCIRFIVKIYITQANE